MFRYVIVTLQNKENEALSPEQSSISRKRTATGNIVLHEIVEQSTSTAPETPAVHLSAAVPGPSCGTPYVVSP